MPAAAAAASASAAATVEPAEVVRRRAVEEVAFAARFGRIATERCPPLRLRSSSSPPLTELTESSKDRPFTK